MILDRVFGVENRHTGGLVVTGAGVDKDATLARVFGGGRETMSGVKVTEETGLGLSAFYAGVRLICWTGAILPLPVFRRKADGDKDALPDHPLRAILNKAPNPEMTAMKFREWERLMILLWGRAVHYVERDGAGRVKHLWPMHTRDVRVDRRPNGDRIYDISSVRDDVEFPRPPVKANILMRHEVLDIANLVGEGVPAHAREQLGEALAAQQFGGGFYAGGAIYAAALKVPGKVRDGGKSLRENLAKVHGSPIRKVAVLEGGAEMQNYGGSLKDQQFTETREFHIPEVSRWLGIPPHKLRDLSRATFSNIAEQAIEWVGDLLPWLKLSEQEYNSRLFGAGSKDLFVEHVVEGLLQADVEKRFTAYGQSVQGSWETLNAIRKRENLNSLGPAGDVLLIPENMRIVPLTDAARTFYDDLEPEPPPEPDPPVADEPEKAEGKDVLIEAAKEGLKSSLRHALGKEAAEIRKAAKDPKAFLDRVDKFYAAYPAKMAAIIEPAVHACRAIGFSLDPQQVAADHCETARSALLDLSGEVKADALETRTADEVAEWERTLPAAITESVFGGNGHGD